MADGDGRSCTPVRRLRKDFGRGENEKGVSQVLYRPREEGQGLVEYMLIILLVAIVVIVALELTGPIVGQMFSNIASEF